VPNASGKRNKLKPGPRSIRRGTGFFVRLKPYPHRYNAKYLETIVLKVLF